MIQNADILLFGPHCSHCFFIVRHCISSPNSNKYTESKERNRKKKRLNYKSIFLNPIVQWLRVLLLMPGTQVQSLGRFHMPWSD